MPDQFANHASGLESPATDGYTNLPSVTLMSAAPERWRRCLPSCAEVSLVGLPASAS